MRENSGIEKFIDFDNVGQMGPCREHFHVRVEVVDVVRARNRTNLFEIDIWREAHYCLDYRVEVKVVLNPEGQLTSTDTKAIAPGVTFSVCQSSPTVLREDLGF